MCRYIHQIPTTGETREGLCTGKNTELIRLDSCIKRQSTGRRPTSLFSLASQRIWPNIFGSHIVSLQSFYSANYTEIDARSLCNGSSAPFVEPVHRCIGPITDWGCVRLLAHLPSPDLYESVWTWRIEQCEVAKNLILKAQNPQCFRDSDH